MPRDSDYEDFLEWKREKAARRPPARKAPGRRPRPDDDEDGFVLVGRAAESFIDRMFPAGTFDDDGDEDPADDDGQGDDGDEDQGDDDDQDPPADPPTERQAHRYFRSGRRAS